VPEIWCRVAGFALVLAAALGLAPSLANGFQVLWTDDPSGFVRVGYRATQASIGLVAMVSAGWGRAARCGLVAAVAAAAGWELWRAGAWIVSELDKPFESLRLQAAAALELARVPAACTLLAVVAVIPALRDSGLGIPRARVLARATGTTCVGVSLTAVLAQLVAPGEFHLVHLQSDTPLVVVARKLGVVALLCLGVLAMTAPIRTHRNAVGILLGVTAAAAIAAAIESLRWVDGECGDWIGDPLHALGHFLFECDGLLLCAMFGLGALAVRGRQPNVAASSSVPPT
jgi:hypothetical protein